MNTKSKLKAISIGIAAIIIMVSLLAAMAVSASPGVVVTDCWIGDDNKVYFTIENTQANEETDYALLNVNGAYEERKKFSLKPGDTATLSFRAEPTPMPDLVVSDKWEEFVNGEVIVHFIVTNIGDAEAGSSAACKYINDVKVDTVSVPELGAGTSCTRAFDPKPCPPGATINVTVCADIYGRVAESNESNNCMITTVTCPPGPLPGGPDLVVENVVIQAFDQNPAGYPTAEWVMLYNPTNESVNISGWSISSIKYPGGGSFTIINISIAARNYLTFVPGKQWLHDEDETVIVKDAAGNIVDKIVNASDGDADNRYWERFDSDWQFGLQTLDKGGMRRGTVKYVYDGDTIHISPVCAKATEFITYNSTEEGKIYSSPVAMAGIQSVRLDGIDAPELGTEEGLKSKRFLEQLCLGKEVVFDIDDGSQYDKYNRVLAMVFCANGTNVNQEMLRSGSAIPLMISPSEFVPYANYTYRPLNPVVNQRITFNASSSWTFDPEAAIISYEWSFGDGTNGTGEITNHSFHSPGNYTVRLEVTDSDGEERRCNAREMTIRICSKNP